MDLCGANAPDVSANVVIGLLGLAGGSGYPTNMANGRVTVANVRITECISMTILLMLILIVCSAAKKMKCEQFENFDEFRGRDMADDLDQERIMDLRQAGHKANQEALTIEGLIQQRDAAIQHIAEWCVAIDVNGTGWDDWDEYYKDAMYRESALPEIRALLVDAIEAARKRRAS